MKKFLLTLLGVAVMSGAAAQDDDNNLEGFVAGINISNAKVSGESLDSKTGFYLGYKHQWLISKTSPIYYEFEVGVSKKGYKMGDAGKISPLYLEVVPLMFNYKFSLSEKTKFYPSVGVYYALGLLGNSEYKSGSDTVDIDTFGSKGVLKGSDIGLRLGATLDFSGFLVGVGYEWGLMNVVKESGSGDMKNRNLFIRVGLAF